MSNKQTRDEILEHIRACTQSTEQAAGDLREAAARYRDVRKNLAGWTAALLTHCDMLSSVGIATVEDNP